MTEATVSPDPLILTLREYLVLRPDEDAGCFPVSPITQSPESPIDPKDFNWSQYNVAGKTVNKEAAETYNTPPPYDDAKDVDGRLQMVTIKLVRYLNLVGDRSAVLRFLLDAQDGHVAMGVGLPPAVKRATRLWSTLESEKVSEKDEEKSASETESETGTVTPANTSTRVRMEPAQGEGEEEKAYQAEQQSTMRQSLPSSVSSSASKEALGPKVRKEDVLSKARNGSLMVGRIGKGDPVIGTDVIRAEGLLVGFRA
jgi:hypothetical protein